MPANTQPIFTLTPNIGHGLLDYENVDSDGVGSVNSGATGQMRKVFTAGSNGSFLQRIRFSVTSGTPATASAATVLRIFISSVGSGATTAADTKLLQEITAAAQNADHSTAATFPHEVVLNMAIPSGYFIHVTTHAAPGSAPWVAVAIGGDY